MATRSSAAPTRRPTNVTLDASAVAEAKALNINVSQACEAGLLAEVNRERERRWQEDNATNIRNWNAWVVKNGLPIKPLF